MNNHVIMLQPFHYINHYFKVLIYSHKNNQAGASFNSLSEKVVKTKEAAKKWLQ